MSDQITQFSPIDYEVDAPAAAEAALRPVPEPGRRRKVAYVLPTYNEGENVDAFYAALAEAVEARTDIEFEFIYVDDGSSDDSFERLLRLRETDRRVTVLSFSRNYGHQMAITAGLDAAATDGTVDAVVIMDTDLQDPPSLSITMIERWERGAQVVYAQRAHRDDTLFKRKTAEAFYYLLDTVTETPIPRNVGDFRLMDRQVVDEIVRYREHSRFVRGIVANVGFRQEPLQFDRGARVAGETHYPLRKMVRLAADGLFSFSTFPLRVCNFVGFAVAVVAALVAVFTAIVYIFDPAGIEPPEWALPVVGVFFLGGVQLIMLGMVGSYVGRTYLEVLDRPLYTLSLVARGDGPAEPPDAGAAPNRR